MGVWELGIQLTKVLQVVDGETVASEVQHHVLQCTGVTVGQHKPEDTRSAVIYADPTIANAAPVAIDPGWVSRGILHDLGPQSVCNRSTTHRSTRMTRLCLLNNLG